MGIDIPPFQAAAGKRVEYSEARKRKDVREADR